MTDKFFILLILCGLLACNANQGNKNENSNEEITKDQYPNIVVFYVDDLGFGDLSSYGATGVATPNVDKLADNGIKFTDAHSPAATCTPSRYALLTGEYAFRLNAAVLQGDAPALIQPGKPTIASMLKSKGYTTGVVGKWHLGLGNGQLDWNQDVKPGPLEIGFDYSFLMPATGDRVPTVYLENRNIVGLNQEDPIAVSYKEKIGDGPTGIDNPELLRQQADPQHSNSIVNGISRIGYQTGGDVAMWVDEDFPSVFTSKAKKFIQKNKEKPFFLFFSFHDIHVPRVPNSRFIGKSNLGLRGDAIVQMDWMTGEIMKTLEDFGLSENTLVIFTSDNGPVLNDGYEDEAVEKLGEHKPWGPYRGGKYSAYEAGTRVPMITYWPGRIKPGESSALMTQVDFFASLAALVEVDDIENYNLDSENEMDALLDADAKGREYMLEESYTLSIRHNNWKFIAPFSKEKPLPQWIKDTKGIEGGFQLEPQLYDLSNDPGERNNVAEEQKELVTKYQEKINTIVNANK